MRGYERKEIEAAIAAKGLNHVKLADKLGRSTTSINKAIRGSSTIKSEPLEMEIVQALQPELDVIHGAFLDNNILNGRELSPELKQQVAGATA